MKKYLHLIASLSLFTLSASASDIQLGWDPPAGTTGITNYTLYASTNVLTATNLTTATVKLNVGTNTTALLEGVAPGMWYFAVTASKGGIQSGPANILPTESPAPPANLRPVYLQWGISATNLSDVGYFRVRIPAP